jgi:hypothetical protein
MICAEGAEEISPALAQRDYAGKSSHKNYFHPEWVAEAFLRRKN